MQYRGVSGFAIANNHFPHRRFLKQFHEDTPYPALAFLSGTFGWSTKGVALWNEQFKDRSRLLEIHFSNGAGRRNQKLQKYELWHKYGVPELNKLLEANNAEVKHELIEWTHQVNAFLKTALGKNTDMLKILVCPELEDNMTDGAFERAKRIISANIEFNVEFVRNKVMCCASGAKWTEAHGERYYWDKLFIYNPDGLSMDFTGNEDFKPKMSVTASKKWLQVREKARVVFTWSATQQGLDGGWLFPRKRFIGKPARRIISNEAIAFNRAWTKGGR